MSVSVSPGVYVSQVSGASFSRNLQPAGEMATEWYGINAGYEVGHEACERVWVRAGGKG